MLSLTSSEPNFVRNATAVELLSLSKVVINERSDKTSDEINTFLLAETTK